jgi:excisionase family DNA binding protein
LSRGFGLNLDEFWIFVYDLVVGGSMEGKKMYTVTQVAERLQLHPQTIREWLRRGTLKGVRMGGTKAGWRIPEGEVARLEREGMRS